MIINNSLNFLFIHVPRAGGTSFSEVLAEKNSWCDIEIGSTEFGEAVQHAYLKRFNLRKHIPAFHLKEIIGDRKWSSMFKFASVRCPYARFVSVYNLLKFGDSFQTNAYANYVRSFNDVNEFIAKGKYLCPEVPDYMFVPQIYWLGEARDYNCSSRIIVDKVYKIEFMKEEILDFKLRLGFEDLKFPTSNSVPTSNVILSNTSINTLNAVYKQDFEILGYAMASLR
jgi:hypothetical protein